MWETEGKLKRSVAKGPKKAEGNKYQKRKKNERKNKFNTNLVKNIVLKFYSVNISV